EKGLYSGRRTSWDQETYIGIFTPRLSGKNFPSSKLDAISNCDWSYRFSCPTCLSNDPNPKVLLLPERVMLAKSASCAFRRALAAQPPSSSNPESRNSFTQIWAVLGSPSSPGLDAFLSGFRTPIMITRILLRSGCPSTVIRLVPSRTKNGSFTGH